MNVGYLINHRCPISNFMVNLGYHSQHGITPWKSLLNLPLNAASAVSTSWFVPPRISMDRYQCTFQFHEVTYYGTFKPCQIKHWIFYFSELSYPSRHTKSPPIHHSISHNVSLERSKLLSVLASCHGFPSRNGCTMMRMMTWYFAT